MRHTRWIVSTVLVAALVASPAWSQAQRGSPEPGLSEVRPTRLLVTPDYERTKSLYAVGIALNCSRDCMRLLRSADSGRSWALAAARNWSGLDLYGAQLGAKGILVSPYAHGIQLSDDGGGTFRNHPSPTGSLGASANSRGSDVVISTDTATYLYAIADQRVSRVPGSSLQQASFTLTNAYRRRSQFPAALVAGVNPSNRFAAVQRCDNSLRCSGTAIVVSKNDVPRLYPSPNFDKDGTVFAALVGGGLYRSTDGGATFSPVPGLPVAQRTVISTIQAVAFTPDFDGRRHVGRVFIAMLGVTGEAGGRGETTGRVLTSRDGGSTWLPVGNKSPLDGGATAVAFTPDGVLVAAYIDMPHGGIGGILYTTDLTTWHKASSRTLDDSAQQGAVNDSRNRAGSSVPDTNGVSGASRDDRTLHAAAQRTSAEKRGVRPLYVVLAALLAAAIVIALRFHLLPRHGRRAAS